MHVIVLVGQYIGPFLSECTNKLLLKDTFGFGCATYRAFNRQCSLTCFRWMDANHLPSVEVIV